MKMKTLKDLLVEQIKDLHSAENQITKALPAMAKAATNPDLKAGFLHHLEQTRGQVTRLEQVCEKMDVTHRGKKCTATEGLIAEGKELLAEESEPGVLDAGLIAAAQKIEHYEIASYGSAIAWAELLGLDEVVELLRATFDEERETDEKLTALALSAVNFEARTEGDDGEEEKRAPVKKKTASRKKTVQK